MNKLTFKVLSTLFVAFFSLNVLAQSQVGTRSGTVPGASAGTTVVAVDTSRASSEQSLLQMAASS